MKIFRFSALTLLMITGQAMAQDVKNANNPDSIQSKKDTSKDVLLNANSATDPRAVPIGLPAAYTIVTQDGMPAVYFWDPNTTQVHWRNEFSLAKVTSATMSMTALLQGEIGVGVESYSELGGDKFKGRMKYNTNTNGLQLFDMNVSGPLAKNWYYSLAAYQNFDPGSTQLAYTNYTDRGQFYTGQITHKYRNGQFTFGYKHTDVHLLNNVDNSHPFVYNGDGTISELEGFKVGQDTYSPIEGRAKYLDLMTGKTVETSYNDGAHYITNEGRFLLDHVLDNGWKWAVKAKFSTNKLSQINDGTNTILRNQTRQYVDGSGSYTGDVQRRLFNIYQGHATDLIFLTTLNKKIETHDLTFGLLDYFNDSENAHSSVQHDHEVAANPKSLLFNGNQFFNFNTSAEYIDGWENKLGGYVMDTWTPNKTIKVTYGARLEYFRLAVDNIPQARYNGFYLGGPTNDGSGIIQKVHNNLTGMNYAVTIVPTIRITDNFGFDGEFNQMTMYRHLQGFYGTGAPIYSNRPHTLGRAGLYFNHPKVSIVTSFAYSFRKNDAGRISVPHPETGVSSMVNYTQAIRTMGWKTDVLYTPNKNFKLNVILTLQSPKLAEYSFSAYGKDYDYAGKYVSGLSKVLLDVTPSYNYKKFNISTTIRYNGKKYGNVANSVYFNGYWETFANASYRVNKNMAFTMNLVNYLNQRGASGNVPGSALVEDGSQFAGTIISGTYMRPFEATAGFRIDF